MENSEFIYRFRSLDKIFKFKELQKQEIYFSPPEKLNDPLEGFQNTYWKGDRSQCESLLKDYLLCYKAAYALAILDNVNITNKRILTFLKFEETLAKGNLGQVSQAKECFKKYFLKFFNEELSDKVNEKLFKFLSKDNKEDLLKVFFLMGQVRSILEFLSKGNKISENKLLICFNIIQPLCYSLMTKHYGDLARESHPDVFDQTHEDNTFNEQFYNHIQQGKAATENFLDNIKEIKFIYDFRDSDKNDTNTRFLLYKFSSKYIEILKECTYFPFYIACFTKTPHNTSIWGNYADGHRGICLKFKMNPIQNGTKGLWLRNEHLLKTDVAEFYDIEYVPKFEQINFFDKEKILDAGFKRAYTKTEEWAYEKESRLIIQSSPEFPFRDDGLSIQYRFPSLDGIIFGIRTPTECKIKIIKIIKDICEINRREDFNFYEAYYDMESGRIECKKLPTFSNFKKLEDTIARLPY